jgi:DNA-binding FadR family transcriptional regulator
VADADITPVSGLSERVADDIRRQILRGDYRPGERLPGERNLADRHGVNRGAVREALRTLGQQRLVATQRSGTTVCALRDASVEILRDLLFAEGTVNRDLAVQLLDVHEMLVAGAARLAIERGSEDELLRARLLVQRLGDPHLAPDALPELLDRIVDLITEASGNLVLRLCRNALQPALAGHLDAIRSLIRPQAPSRQPLIEDLDRAIEARDGPALEEAVRGLLRLRRTDLMSALDDIAPESETAPDPKEERA